ncbi:MAG: cobalamin biosynthesis protein [Chloroflexi bacterium]|nr:cobalamin biosynthesis protein [Chloroflexota bacterium]
MTLAAPRPAPLTEAENLDIFLLVPALALDLALGEPPLRLHPVAWMGSVIGRLEKHGHGRRPGVQLVYGALLSLLTVAIFTLPVHFLLPRLEGFSSLAALAVGALLVKTAFSFRGLRESALNIKRLLTEDKITEARFELRSLVGRDTSRLDEPLIISATVESVAENATDSFVAPVFYLLLLGVPGAVGYRVVNTLDAMIGRHGRYEYLGKFAARLDTVLNYIPARLTALLIIFAAWLYRRNRRASWRVARAHHALTESPNAGWTMAAMAGALDVTLEKVGFYRLGTGGAPLTCRTIDDSLQLAQAAMYTWAALGLAIGAIRLAAT